MATGSLSFAASGGRPMVRTTWRSWTIKGQAVVCDADAGDAARRGRRGCSRRPSVLRLAFRSSGVLCRNRCVDDVRDQRMRLHAAPRRAAALAPAGLPALRPGMASWTTPDLSRLPRRPSICLTCDQVAVEDRARRCATDEALRRLVKACAGDWEWARRALDAAGGDVSRVLARAERAGSAKRVSGRGGRRCSGEMTARASLETLRNGRAGIPRGGSPKWWVAA